MMISAIRQVFLFAGLMACSFAADSSKPEFHEEARIVKIRDMLGGLNRKDYEVSIVKSPDMHYEVSIVKSPDMHCATEEISLKDLEKVGYDITKFTVDIKLERLEETICRLLNQMIFKNFESSKNFEYLGGLLTSGEEGDMSSQKILDNRDAIVRRFYEVCLDECPTFIKALTDFQKAEAEMVFYRDIRGVMDREHVETLQYNSLYRKQKVLNDKIVDEWSKATEGQFESLCSMFNYPGIGTLMLPQSRGGGCCLKARMERLKDISQQVLEIKAKFGIKKETSVEAVN